MNKSIYKQNLIISIIAESAQYLFTVAVLALIILGLGQAERSSKEEGLRALEDAVNRAVVTCYAIEGSYPESVAYIQQHYGVHVDESKYTVQYVIFGENLFPDITVVEK